MKTNNNWEVWHELTWTEFELHSAIFGTLRKNLYPKYLVRGEYVFITKDNVQLRPDIAIFIPHQGKPAELKLIIEIKAEHALSQSPLNQQQVAKYEEHLKVPVILAQGKAGLKGIVSRVMDALSEDPSEIRS